MSFVRRAMKLSNFFQSGYSSAGIHTKHYRPNHSKINECRDRFTCDYKHVDVEVAGEDRQVEFGINKQVWNAHEEDGFDEYKDGNSYE